MAIFTQKNRWLINLAIFVLLAMFAKLWSIRSIPAVISNDEIFYVAQAQSLAISGRDLTGLWQPLQFTPAHPLFAEWPGVVMTPAAWIFPNDPVLAARATHIVLGSLIPLWLSLMVYYWQRSRKLAFIVLLLTTVNPWIWQQSRMSYDAMLSLSFYFLGLVLMWWLPGKKRLLSLLPLSIGFFQYQGLKILFIPVVLVSLLAVLFQEKEQSDSWSKSIKRQWPLITVGLSMSFLFGWYVLSVQSQTAGSRLADLIFFNKEELDRLVDMWWQWKFNSSLNRLYLNQFAAMTAYIWHQYLVSFEPVLLFVKGEGVRNPTSMFHYGFFHPIDAVFMLAGMIHVLTRKYWRIGKWWLGLLIVMAPLASAIQTKDTWVMFRSSLLWPLLAVVVAIGFYRIYQSLNRLGKVGLVSVYALFVSNFFYQYYYHYPIYSAADDFWAQRVLSSYISRQPNQKFIIATKESYFSFLNYLVYTNSIIPENISQIRQAMQTEQYTLGNVTFSTDMEGESGINVVGVDENTILVVDQSTAIDEAIVTANSQTEKIAIASLIDHGAIYTIYNDRLCTPHNLEFYQRVERNILNVESLANSDMCRNFFVYKRFNSDRCISMGGQIIDTSKQQTCDSVQQIEMDDNPALTCCL